MKRESLRNQQIQRRRRTGAILFLAAMAMMSTWTLLVPRPAQASEWNCYDCRFDRVHVICTGIADEYCECCELNP